jgi:hypothetical protein
MFSIFRALINYIYICSKDKQMHFGFMKLILLYSDYRHVSATHVEIFRVVSARIQIYIFIVCQDHFTVTITEF